MPSSSPSFAVFDRVGIGPVCHHLPSEGKKGPFCAISYPESLVLPDSLSEANSKIIGFCQSEKLLICFSLD
jgi:hypothetical protein